MRIEVVTQIFLSDSIEELKEPVQKHHMTEYPRGVAESPTTL